MHEEGQSRLERARAQLGEARVLLLFTPELCTPGRDALEVLSEVLPAVDLVQVRIKAPGDSDAPTEAAALHKWTRRVLELVAASDRPELPVMVNDRVDVAAALLPEGCVGVHLGDQDMPPHAARSVLGPAPLLGLSTHSVVEAARGAEQPVDYLGFGPVNPTPTKGYERGLGPEAAWVADQGVELPLFPIGGITPDNADELAPVGRAAVSAAILGAPEPLAAARLLRAQLSLSIDERD